MNEHAIWQLIKVPCTVRHQDPGPVDEYGDHPIAMVTETSELCHPQQSARGETDEIEHERWHVYLRPPSVVDANDVIVVDGMTLEVDGAPWPVIDPLTGWRTHIETTAIRRI